MEQNTEWEHSRMEQNIEWEHSRMEQSISERNVTTPFLSFPSSSVATSDSSSDCPFSDCWTYSRKTCRYFSIKWLRNSA